MQNEDRSVVKSVSNRVVNNKIKLLNGVSAMGLGVSTSSRSANDRGIALSQSSGSSTDSDRSCRHEPIVDCLTESEEENSDDEMDEKDIKRNDSKCNQSLNNSLWDLNNKGRFRDIIEATGVLDFSSLYMRDSSLSQFIVSLNESLATSEKELEKSFANECEESQEEISRQLKIIGFLRRACEMKDLEAIDLVTRYITDENGRIEPADSLLRSAAAHGSYSLCECLLEMGVNVDDRSMDSSFTPLMEASLRNYVDIVKLLCHNGADVGAKTADADTPLHLAAGLGYEQVVKVLVQYNANIEEHNENGHTPLMKAACEGHIEVAAFLIKQGAGINHYSNEFKETALTLAAYKGQLKMVQFLLNNGANCDHKTEEMHTAFMEAAMGGHVEVGRLLLERGVQVNMPPDSFESPLTLAACGGHIEFAKLLLDNGADIEERDDEGLSPLMEAAREDHIDMVEFLISRGANIHARTKSNQDVFILACKHGRKSIAELLVKHGAVVDREMDGGYTALLVAAKLGHYSTVQYLIEQGADVNKSTTNYEETVLSAAVSSGNVHVVHLLLKHNANPHFRLQDGTTMLIEAAKGGHADIAKLLFNWLSNESSPLALHELSIESLTCINNDLYNNEDVRGNNMEEYQFVTKDLPNVPVSMTTYPPMNEVNADHIGQSQGASSSENSDNDEDEEDDDYEESETTDKFIKMRSMYVKQCRNLQQCSLGSSMLALKRQCLKQRKKLFSTPQELHLNDTQHLKHLITSSLNPSQLKKKHVRSNTIATSTLAMTSSSSSSMTTTTTTTTGTTLCGRNHLNHNEDMCGMCGCLKAMKTMEEVDRKSQNGCQTCTSASIYHHHHHHTSNDGIPCCKLHPKAICNMLNRQINANVVDQNPQAPSKQQQGQLTNDVNNYNLVNCPPDQLAPPISASPLPLYRPINLDVDAQTLGNQDTALTLSCSRGHIEIVCLLLSKGSNFEHRDKKGFTPLLHAASFGHPRIVEILINAGADIEVETERTKDTALSLASANGHAKVVELLIRRGLANIEHRNMSDYTPLCQAASGGHVQVIELLLHYGAEINSRTNSKLGISPLMLAAMNGHAEAVSILLDRGSDVNAQIETNRNTALTLACYQGQHEVVSLLADRKANLEHRAKAGLTPLMEAAQGGFVEVGRILLDRGADVGAMPLTASRDTALGIAAEKGHCEFVELLLSRNAPVDVKNKKGTTALWMACNAGHLDVVKALVSRGADPDSTDNRKVSCLGAALRKGFEKIVKFLVSHVSHLPSDPDCLKLQKSFHELDKPELKNSCLKCLEIIKKAKEAQAMKAFENAAILLDELQQEKKMEAKKRAAREKKREKRKQKKKDRFVSGSITPNNLNNGNERRDSSVELKAENSSGSQGVSDEDKPEPMKLTVSDEEVGGKENNPKCIVSAKSGNNSIDNPGNNKKSKKNKADKNKNDDNNDKSNTTLTNQKDSIKLKIITTTISSLPLQESKAQVNQCPEKIKKESLPLLKTKLSGIGDLDDFALLPCTMHTSIVAAPVLLASRSTTQKLKVDTKTSKLPSESLKDSTYVQKSNNIPTTRIVSGSSSIVSVPQKPLLSTIPSQTITTNVTYKPALAVNSLSSGAKPFAKKKIISGSSNLNASVNASSLVVKKEDVQSFLLKDPLRKMRKVDVPARAVSRVIGRAGCNINAIREFSGAKIDLDKLKTCDDAVVTIRGTNDSVNKAAELIQALVRESDKDIDQLINAFKQQQLTGGSLLGISTNFSDLPAPTNVWKSGNSLLVKNSITIPSSVSSNNAVKDTTSLIPPNNVWESRKIQNSLASDASKSQNNAWLKQSNKEINSSYSRPTVISSLNMGGSNVWDNSMADGIGKSPGSSVSLIPEDKPEPITTFPIGAWKSVSKNSEIRSTNPYNNVNNSTTNTTVIQNQSITVKENSSWPKTHDPPSSSTTTSLSSMISCTTATITTVSTTFLTVSSVQTTISEALSTSSMQQYFNYDTINAIPSSTTSYSFNTSLLSSATAANQETTAEYSIFGGVPFGSHFLNNQTPAANNTTSSVSSNLIGSLSDITVDKSKAPGYRPPSYQYRSHSPSLVHTNQIYQSPINPIGFVSNSNPTNSVNKYSTAAFNNNNEVNMNYQFSQTSSDQQQQLSTQKKLVQDASASSTEITVQANPPAVNSLLNPNAPNFNSKPDSLSPQTFYKTNMSSLYSSGVKYGVSSPAPSLTQQHIPINSNDIHPFSVYGNDATNAFSYNHQQPSVEVSQRRFSIGDGITGSSATKSLLRAENTARVANLQSACPSILQQQQQQVPFIPYTATVMAQQQKQQSYQQQFPLEHFQKLPNQLQPIGTERNSKKQLVFNNVMPTTTTTTMTSSSSSNVTTLSLVTNVQPSVTTVMSILPSSTLDMTMQSNDQQVLNNIQSWGGQPGMTRNTNAIIPSHHINAPVMSIPTATYLYTNNNNNNNVHNSRPTVNNYNNSQPQLQQQQQLPVFNSNLANMNVLQAPNQYLLANGSALSSIYQGRLTPQLQQQQQHYQQQQQQQRQMPPPVLHQQQQQQQQNSFFYHHSSSYPRFPPQEVDGWHSGVQDNSAEEVQPWNMWTLPENNSK